MSDPLATPWPDLSAELGFTEAEEERIAAEEQRLRKVLRACRNDLCERLIGGSAAYCCGACSIADERHFEIHESGPLGHSADCSERWAQRQGVDRG